MTTFYQRTFQNRHVVLPVVHVEAPTQALRNVGRAVRAKADGVFLIGHGMRHDVLAAIHVEVRRAFPDFWVGVNFLDLDPRESFARLGADGLWADDACIDERASAQDDAEEIARARRESLWDGLYFGGVAFKHQRPVRDLEGAARIAARYMDVVTTSGDATGHAPDPSKIATMKRGCGVTPLAVASGITPDNVANYMDVADCFLVATGASSSFTELDPRRLEALVQRVRAYAPPSLR
jgi:predicted TIM-barrel enzyme